MKAYKDRRELLETMLLIRAFDEKVDELYAEGALHGTAHFYVGQEAVAVGVISALMEGDVITGTHRGHGHAIAFGLDIDRMAAELLGRASGYCRGKGGSMHIADVAAGMLGANGIVGGSMGIACGAAWAFKRRKEERVAVCFFGDGAVGEGIFNEALNLGAIWKLPIVFVCENNQYAMSLSVKRGFAHEPLSDRAAGYGMPGRTVDGMELDEVHEAASEAVGRARGGGGPTLIEAVTYRYLGHSKSDANLYRTRDEIQEWRVQDPIQRFDVGLKQEGVLESNEWRSIERSAKERIEEAFERAAREPEPEPESALEDVYA
jgi:TPP-dependent pyruvate/acetoin dehydrogenase alpha subunit